jgi:hypothetical protein
MYNNFTMLISVTIYRNCTTVNINKINKFYTVLLILLIFTIVLNIVKLLYITMAVTMYFISSGLC